MTIEEIIKAYQPLSMEEAAEILQVYEDLQTALNLLRQTRVQFGSCDACGQFAYCTECGGVPGFMNYVDYDPPKADGGHKPDCSLGQFLSRFPDPKKEDTE